MKRTKRLQRILEVLSGHHEKLNVSQLVQLVNDIDDSIGANKRNIVEDLKHIDQAMGYSLKTTQGRYGGYQLSQAARKQLSKLTMLQLSMDQRNALNDAFELASRHKNFHYQTDLVDAKNLLYKKKDLKDDDFEYYLGARGYDKKQTKLLKIVKQAIVEGKRMDVRFEHVYYGCPKTLTKTSGLFIFHDSDETFIIFKDKAKTYSQNMLNLKSVKILDLKANRGDHKKSDFVNKYTLKIKGTYSITLSLLNNDGKRKLKFRHLEGESEILTNGDYKFTFYEKYHGIEFLVSMYKYINIKKISPELKESWNRRMDLYKKINP